MRDDASTQFDEEVGLMIKTQGGGQQAYARLSARLAPVWSLLIIPTQFVLWLYVAAWLNLQYPQSFKGIALKVGR